ncbi:MAG: hypothetical protein ACM368_02140 [Gemmatimonadota bacterium]
MEQNPMTPITIQRFVKELDKLKHEVDAGTLEPENYDGRLARIIRELRERGLDSDRAAATAALADAVARGVLTSPMKEHIQSRLGLT